VKTGVFRATLVLFGTLLAATQESHGAAPCTLNLEPASGKMVLSWPTTMESVDLGVIYPQYTVEWSPDLQHWQSVGGKLRGLRGGTGPRLNLSMNPTPGTGFFRVNAQIYSRAPQTTGAGGSEVFGYDTRFADELNWLGLLPVEALATNFPQPSYLPQIDFDPTAAQFWSTFNTNAAFQLNSNELAVFLTNGFVVSERLGSIAPSSFGGIYYRVFHGDLPVFVTTDSILQAWHRTYLNMLEELEELELATLQEQILSNAAARLLPAWNQYRSGPLSNSIVDADYFLTVARSLWAGQQVSNSIDVAGQALAVSSTLNAISNQTLVSCFPIFGSVRTGIDFSQFKVRGHYTNSDRLKRYFQTLMWCGFIDLRMVTYPPNEEDDIRQLGTAVVLDYLLKQSGQLPNWLAFDQITRAFVGRTDSMTFPQMDQLLTAANVHSLADLPDYGALTNLQTRLVAGNLGLQSITSDVLFSPWGPGEMELPRSFTVFGQKFVLDSWAFEQVVFDKIHWPSDNTNVYCGVTNLFEKVIRRKPSCLDVAFSVFGNDQTVPDIGARITSTNGEPFRDGLPYQHNLTAARNVIDTQNAAVWSDNFYTAWLAALRALSAPTTDIQYPEAMRTRAWAMKTLNTQLASWTELRHDTVLYAKQSYTSPFVCSYPFGFVEPRLEFWQRMQALADLAASAISNLTLSGSVTVLNRTNKWVPFPQPITCDLSTVKSNQVAALRNFSAQMATLQAITAKELAQQPLDAMEADFLISIIEDHGVCRPPVTGWTGWYPGLFYVNVFWWGGDSDEFAEFAGCNMVDRLVTDVHTDVPEVRVCDPGAVIHEGVGNVHLLMIAVDNGPDRMVYAGPVFSHYEFEVPGANRLSDEDWKAKLDAGQKPPSPEWTRSYLVPSP
jgi:hypothetical protein